MQRYKSKFSAGDGDPPLRVHVSRGRRSAGASIVLSVIGEFLVLKVVLHLMMKCSFPIFNGQER